MSEREWSHFGDIMMAGRRILAQDLWRWKISVIPHNSGRDTKQNATLKLFNKFELNLKSQVQVFRAIVMRGVCNYWWVLMIAAISCSCRDNPMPPLKTPCLSLWRSVTICVLVTLCDVAPEVDVDPCLVYHCILSSRLDKPYCYVQYYLLCLWYEPPLGKTISSGWHMVHIEHVADPWPLGHQLLWER